MDHKEVNSSFSSHLTFTNFANENLLNGNFDINWEKICDNRDLQLLSTNHFEFESLITEKLHSKTFSDEVLWLRYRIGLMRCLLVAQYLAEQPAGTGEQVLNGNTKEKADSQLPTAEEFVDLLERLKEISKLATESATQDTFKVSTMIRVFSFVINFLFCTVLSRRTRAKSTHFLLQTKVLVFDKHFAELLRLSVQNKQNGRVPIK